MKTLTPSAMNICNAAMSHFAECGYSAASLSKIGEAAGIRKASIYAHFSGKDDLFMNAYSKALRDELDFMRECFKKDEAVYALAGYSYCRGMRKRYKFHPSFRFVLMGAYFQPHSLKGFLDDNYSFYIRELGGLFAGSLRRMKRTKEMPEKEVVKFTHAYLGIADSLHVELLYTGGRVFDKRLAAMWSILSDCVDRAEI